MIGKVILKIKQLFCRHTFTEIDCCDCYVDDQQFIIKVVQCDKCKKVISLDSRRDDYESTLKKMNIDDTTKVDKVTIVIRKV